MRPFTLHPPFSHTGLKGRDLGRFQAVGRVIDRLGSTVTAFGHGCRAHPQANPAAPLRQHSAQVLHPPPEQPDTHCAVPCQRRRGGVLTVGGVHHTRPGDIVARKAAQRSTGFVNEVRADLRAVMHRELDPLWAEGVGGADFLIASIAVFGAYDRVIDYKGKVIRVDRLLDGMRAGDRFRRAAHSAERLRRRDFAAHPLLPAVALELRRGAPALRRSAQTGAVVRARPCRDVKHMRGAARKQNEFVRLAGPHKRR